LEVYDIVPEGSLQRNMSMCAKKIISIICLLSAT
jgi:hypothetical protein